MMDLYRHMSVPYHDIHNDADHLSVYDTQVDGSLKTAVSVCDSNIHNTSISETGPSK